MLHKLSPTLFDIFAIIPVCISGNLQAAGSRPPAGQMCAEGSYVAGFDAEGNIICTVPGGTGLPVPVETLEHINSQGELACPPGCLTGTTETVATDEVETANKLMQSGSTVVNEAKPVISDIKPSWIVFGSRETSIVIIGAGFTDESVVKFQDSAYSPSVNPSGTELRVTIATRKLPIGRYAITVSNGPGLETTQRRALEVY